MKPPWVKGYYYIPIPSAAKTRRDESYPTRTTWAYFSQKVDRRRRCYLAETSVVGGESSGSNSWSLKRGNEMFIEEEKIWCWPYLGCRLLFWFFCCFDSREISFSPPHSWLSEGLTPTARRILMSLRALKNDGRVFLRLLFCQIVCCLPTSVKTSSVVRRDILHIFIRKSFVHVKTHVYTQAKTKKYS